MKEISSKLTSGVLFECFEKVRANFYDKIDENIHAKTYEGAPTIRFAEPEFTGKFMDICARYFEREGDERALKKGMAVVDSIEKHMRDDGYLGCLNAGQELLAFSVWNHGFTLYGLTRMYEATADNRILELIRRAADWIVNTFTGDERPDILEASNAGSQNISCLFAMGRAYAVTKDKRYLDFIKSVIDYCETTDMNLLSFDNILNLRSQKGIEMIVVYLGVLQYGLMTDDDRAVKAAERYFEQIRLTQIRNTGNGTIFEKWTENGNAPRLMPTEEKPNETCVAVGIMEMALSLFYVKQDAKYLDAIEKTLFNHMVGSLEKSGSDLAYYQGNYGRKIYRTDGGAYQCCRYRGFTFFSYLNDMLWYFDGKTLIPMVYASSEYAADGVTCSQTTNYPASGDINISVNTDKDIKLKLRVPAWCENYSLKTDDKVTNVTPENGYLEVNIPKGKTEIKLNLKEKVATERHEIDEKKYLSVTYGPLLMAHDTHFGGEQWQPLKFGFKAENKTTNGEAIVRLDTEDMTLVDFASAGGNDPENDLYTVFIPEA